MRSPDIDTRLLPGFVLDVRNAALAYRQVSSFEPGDSVATRHAYSDVLGLLSKFFHNVGEECAGDLPDSILIEGARLHPDIDALYYLPLVEEFSLISFRLNQGGEDQVSPENSDFVGWDALRDGRHWTLFFPVEELGHTAFFDVRAAGATVHTIASLLSNSDARGFCDKTIDVIDGLKIVYEDSLRADTLRRTSDLQARLTRFVDTVARLPFSSLWLPRTFSAGLCFLPVTELVPVVRLYNRKTANMKLIGADGAEISPQQAGLSEDDLWADCRWDDGNMDEVILNSLPPILKAALRATDLEIPGWEYLNREGKF